MFINHSVNDQHIFNLGSRYYWNSDNDRQIIIYPNKDFTYFQKIKVKIKIISQVYTLSILLLKITTLIKM